MAYYIGYWMLAVVLLILFWRYKEDFGRLLISCIFPKYKIGNGDNVNVYLNGEYNRTAKVTGISSERMIIYGCLPLPISYRGRFYAAAFSENGDRLIYVGNKRHFRFVRVAEVVRKMFEVTDYDNFIPDSKQGIDDGTDEMEEAEDDM